MQKAKLHFSCFIERIQTSWSQFEAFVHPSWSFIACNVTRTAIPISRSHSEVPHDMPSRPGKWESRAATPAEDPRIPQMAHMVLSAYLCICQAQLRYVDHLQVSSQFCISHGCPIWASASSPLLGMATEHNNSKAVIPKPWMSKRRLKRRGGMSGKMLNQNEKMPWIGNAHSPGRLTSTTK